MINYAKKTFAALLLMMVATVANAAVKYTIEDLNIAAGETQTVTVNMENDAPVWTFEFRLTLPEGLKPDMNTLKAAERLQGDKLQYYVSSTYIDKEGSYRITAFPLNLEAVPAGKGAIVTFDVKAEDALADNTKIEFSGLQTLNQENKAVEASSEAGDVAKVDNEYTVTANPTEVTLAKADATASVEILLENADELWGFQGNITLPAGVTLEGDVEKTTRLGSFVINTNKVSDTEYFFFTASPSDLVSITGNSGAVIKFTVKAGEGIVDGSAIKVINLKTVKKSTEGKVNLNSVTINITTKDANEDAYKALSEEVAALQKQLDDAKTELATEAKDVDITEDAKAIQDQIDAIKQKLDADYEAQALNEESKLDEEATKKVADDIAKLIADAKEKQNAISVGISTVKAANTASEVYTAAGQRVSAPVKGVNIINGKKVILK